MIAGLQAASGAYCKIVDAPGSMIDASIHIKIRLVRFQGWISDIEDGLLNDTQLKTFTEDILPQLKKRIADTSDEITKICEAPETLKKTAEWVSHKEEVMKIRFKAIDQILKQGDLVFRGLRSKMHNCCHDNSRHNPEAASTDDDSGNGSSAESHDEESLDISSSSGSSGQSPHDAPGSVHESSADDSETNVSGDQTAVDSFSSTTLPISSSGGGLEKDTPAELDQQISVDKFLDGFSEVYKQVDPWARVYLTESRFEAGSHEDFFYRLISTLRAHTTVAGTPDSYPQSGKAALGTPQRWLRAGAWYLALVSITTTFPQPSSALFTLFSIF